MTIMPIRAIRVQNRPGKELGDLEPLARSIKAAGPLRPIGITRQGELVFGERQLQACRDLLKWKTISTRIVDISSIAAGQYGENELRNDFTPSERVAIAAMLKAAISQRRNRSIPHKSGELTGRTDDYLARLAGFGNRDSYRRAKKVVEHGTPELIQAMDDGKVAISVAALLAGAPADVQRQTVQLGKPAIRQRAILLRRRPCLGQDGRAGSLAPPHFVQPSAERWTVTMAREPRVCDLVIARQPCGTPLEPWTAEELRAFTVDWCRRWSVCGADYFAIFWMPDLLSEGRDWINGSLHGYQFQQELVYQGPVRPECRGRLMFARCWQPILIYRRAGLSGRPRGADRTALDLHVPGGRAADRAGTAVASNGSDECLVSVMSWLIGTLTRAGQQVVSLGCGDCPCGVAALTLGRLFHGIESDRDAIDRAAARLKRVEQAAAK